MFAPCFHARFSIVRRREEKSSNGTFRIARVLAHVYIRSNLVLDDDVMPTCRRGSSFIAPFAVARAVTSLLKIGHFHDVPAIYILILANGFLMGLLHRRKSVQVNQQHENKS
jgi:hypothetical protein